MTASLRGPLTVGLRNLADSLGNVLIGLLGFAAVMFVFTLMMASRQGMREIVGQQIPSTSVVIVRAGAPNEMFSNIGSAERETIQNNLRASHLDAALSAEAVIPVTLVEVASGKSVSVPLRGVSRSSATHGSALVAGRWFQSGTTEVVVGTRAAREFVDARLGSKLRLGKIEWDVVGIFDAKGTLFESELWADLSAVQGAYGRGSAVQAIYVDKPELVSLKAMETSVNLGAESSFDVLPARSFFAGQIKFLQSYVDISVAGLTLFMLVSVLFATISIMHSLVEARLPQYQILNAVGFQRSSLALAIALEGGAIGLAGAALGIASAVGLFDAYQVTTSSSASTLAFQLHVAPMDEIMALVMATVVGSTGALLAAWKVLISPKALASRLLV